MSVRVGNVLRKKRDFVNKEVKCNRQLRVNLNHLIIVSDGEDGVSPCSTSSSSGWERSSFTDSKCHTSTGQ